MRVILYLIIRPGSYLMGISHCMEIPTTKCSICKKELLQDSDHFYVRSKEPLIFRKDCKECIRKRGSKYREENYEKVLKAKKEYYQKNHDKVLKYSREYNARPEVKAHQKEYRKEYYQTENGQKNRFERSKRYTSKPNVKAAIAARKRERYHDNLDVSRAQAREYMKRPDVKEKTRARYHATKTPQKRLRNCIRTSIIYHIKRKGQTKDESLVKHLGYSLDDLKIHLECLWEPWMNWENWGLYCAETWNDNDSKTWTWHIDHIKRHREFKYSSVKDPEFKECWALTNLRPLSAKENVIRQ